MRKKYGSNAPTFFDALPREDWESMVWFSRSDEVTPEAIEAVLTKILVPAIENSFDDMLKIKKFKSGGNTLSERAVNLCKRVNELSKTIIQLSFSYFNKKNCITSFIERALAWVKKNNPDHTDLILKEIDNSEFSNLLLQAASPAATLRK